MWTDAYWDLMGKKEAQMNKSNNFIVAKSVMYRSGGVKCKWMNLSGIVYDVFSKPDASKINVSNI